MKKAKKILSLFMTLIMIISIIPMSTITASATEISGTCGENLAWTFDEETGTLTISGIGEMNDYDWDSPWDSFKENIKMVVIESGVTTIGKFAFAGCEKLESVTIPDSIISIGLVPFTVCKNLASITVDSNNQFYTNDENGVLFNKDKTKLILYPAGTERASYVVSEGVITIGVGAFIFCEKLESVIIPDGVTTIDDYAFGECGNLKNITIPESVTKIGDEAFAYCERLSSVYYSGTVEQWDKILIGSNNSDLIKAPIHYNVHKCNYNVTTSQPTCTEQGFTIYTCLKCGDSYVDDYIDATGHNYKWTTIIDATCKKQGVNLGECIECGNLAVEYIDETEHIYESIVTVPTCKEKGYTTYICACGNSYVEDYVDATGHDYTWSTLTEPTCTKDGVSLGVCENCKDVLVDYTDATGHNIVDGDCINCDYTENVENEENINDNNNDNDNITDEPSVECDHSCHNGGFLWKITLFFNKLFGTNKYCSCGVAHY